MSGVIMIGKNSDWLSFQDKAIAEYFFLVKFREKRRIKSHNPNHVFGNVSDKTSGKLVDENK